MRIVNRASAQCLSVPRKEGVDGAAITLSDSADTDRQDTDRQNWTLQVAEVDSIAESPSKMLAIPASELIGKPHPSTKEELRKFLHGTTWSIRYGTMTGSEKHRMTFDKKGIMTLHYGRVSSLHFLSPKTIKLWNYD